MLCILIIIAMKNIFSWKKISNAEMGKYAAVSFFFKLKKVAKTIEQMNNAGDNNHLERSAYTVVWKAWHWHTSDTTNDEMILTLWSPPVSAPEREYLASLSLYEETSSE